MKSVPENIFNFPIRCCVNQRIGKVLFAENGPLTPADRRTFKDDISEIVCSYVMNDEHGIMLNAYVDEEHDFSCLVRIDVFLKKTNKASRIAELCHRAMPYPLIVVLHDEDRLWFSMAGKRFSRDGKGNVVLEQTTDTGWLSDIHLEAFSEVADFDKFKKNNYLELYCHYVEMLDVLKSAEITGTFELGTLSPTERRRLLEEQHQLQLRLVELKAKAKNELEIPRLVELNMQAQQIKEQLRDVEKQLK